MLQHGRSDLLGWKLICKQRVIFFHVGIAESASLHFEAVFLRLLGGNEVAIKGVAIREATGRQLLSIVWITPCLSKKHFHLIFQCLTNI